MSHNTAQTDAPETIRRDMRAHAQPMIQLQPPGQLPPVQPNHGFPPHVKVSTVDVLTSNRNHFLNYQKYLAMDAEKQSPRVRSRKRTPPYRGSEPDDSDYPDNYQPQPAKKARTTKKATSKDVGTCSMSKKEIGDHVKACLAIEKYEIPRTRVNLTMDTLFFRSFFVQALADIPTGHKLTPVTFDETTPVVVLELDNHSAGLLLGVSKVKGGNRYSTTNLAGMSVVFYPLEGTCSIWVSI